MKPLVKIVSVIPPIANRFVAGETSADTVAHARQLEERGVSSICNFLGEHYENPELAAADRDTYCLLMKNMTDAGLRTCISVKPSQIGLDISESLFRENFATIVDQAAATESFVWLDMEDHTTTDATLNAYTENVVEYEGVGVCVQANLERTPDDLRELADLPGKVRLVKGAYDEPDALAHQKKSDVDKAYRNCLETMFKHFEDGIAVASHDPAMIEQATNLHKKFGSDFEIQMLMGVREDAQYKLANNHDVWQYVPYGEKWLSYFYRRVMERRENLVFALRALLDR